MRSVTAERLAHTSRRRHCEHQRSNPGAAPPSSSAFADDDGRDVVCGHNSAFSRLTAPELCTTFAPKIGRREDRVRAAPAVSRAKVAKKRTRAYRFSGSSPAFPAQRFYGLFRALPGETGLLSPSPPRSLLLRNLTPAIGRQDHTTSPSAQTLFVKSVLASIAPRIQRP